MVNDINHGYITDDKKCISELDAIIVAQLLKMTKISDHVTFFLIKMYFQDITNNQRY